MEVLSYYSDKLPILGVCLGHQAIGEFFGWELTKALRPMHGKISTIQHDGHGLFEGIPSPYSVVRYHSLVLEANPQSPLIANAFTSEGEVMGLYHRKRPICGIQFHPEAVLTQYGKMLIRNWVDGLMGEMG